MLPVGYLIRWQWVESGNGDHYLRSDCSGKSRFKKMFKNIHFKTHPGLNALYNHSVREPRCEDLCTINNDVLIK